MTLNRPEPALIRVSLKTFLGEEQYRKFLEAGVREPLKDWQERAWEKFIERYPQLAVTATERFDALDVCPVHERALLPGFTDSMTDGNFAPDPDRLDHYPRAPWLPLLPAGIQRVRYCPDCIAEKAEYLKRKSQR